MSPLATGIQKGGIFSAAFDARRGVVLFDTTVNRPGLIKKKKGGGGVQTVPERLANSSLDRRNQAMLPLSIKTAQGRVCFP